MNNNWQLKILVQFPRKLNYLGKLFAYLKLLRSYFIRVDHHHNIMNPLIKVEAITHYTIDTILFFFSSNNSIPITDWTNRSTRPIRKLPSVSCMYIKLNPTFFKRTLFNSKQYTIIEGGRRCFKRQTHVDVTIHKGWNERERERVAVSEERTEHRNRVGQEGPVSF